MDDRTILRWFEVCIGTDRGRDTRRVLAQNSMAAYRWALYQFGDGGVVGTRLRSLVVRPAA